MLDTLHMIFWALMVLGVLIFIHELGHFLIARFFDVHVEVFSLGFGPKIFSFRGRGGETEYKISAIPLGGYVKMLGESDQDEKEAIPREQLPRAFFNKPVHVRFLVVFAGPFFNFLLAIVVLFLAYVTGIEEQLPIIGRVTADMPASQAGLKSGDKIIMIDHLPIMRWETLSETIAKSGGNRLNMTVEREGAELTIAVTPKIKSVRNIFGEEVQIPMIGIGSSGKTVLVQYGIGDSLIKGLSQSWKMVDLTVTSIWKLIARELSTDQIGGPLLIAELAGKTASQGKTDLLFFMALISINLGILNLLPIPVLDGGHLLFFAIEGIKGSPLNQSVQLIAQRVGIAFLAGLMILAIYNDVIRLVTTKQ